MKKVFTLSVIGIALFACSEKDDPVIADFDVIVIGEAPNATVSLTNKSSGSTSFKWNFDKGAADSISTIETPAAFGVDRAGEFKVKLTAMNGAEKNIVEKKVNIEGHNAIMVFNNIEFSKSAGDAVYGRYFSFQTGSMYKDNQINSTNGSSIHLGFGSMDNVMYYFESPTKTNLGFISIPNATVTKVVNWEATPRISASQFDAMQDDRLLSGLTITNTNDSFGNSLPNMILFEISTGRKGVIKAKAVNSDRLLVDIKIQKY